jgi:putative ABC transport system substrate-binding protein
MRRRDFVGGVAGTAAGWPVAVRAQQKAMPVIGFLSADSPSKRVAAALTAFRQGLGEMGYIEGQNLAIEYRWAERNPDRLPALAADLVGREVDVIAAGVGGGPIKAAKAATSTIPIVFINVGDPVEAGLVASLTRPGGNITGMSNMLGQLTSKRLELLCELVPRAKVIALLQIANNEYSPFWVKDVEEAARVNGVQLPILKARTEGEIDAAFASLIHLPADGLVIGSNPDFLNRGEQIVALTLRHAVPTIFFARIFAVAGGLISYGAAVLDMYRQGGVYVGKILKGAKPAELPVQQPTKFQLVINLKTAKAIGLTVPPLLLARADEVIE